VDTAFIALVAALFGLAIGSFLTVVVDRVPKRESIVTPRSRCPGCGAAIANRDNIPVLSYLVLRGKCRHCGERISPRYPAIELVTALAFAATAISHESLYVAVMLCALDAVLVAVSAIDIERHLIPNRITYPATIALAVVVVLGWAIGAPLDPARAGIGLLLYGGAFLLIALISRGMGMGDVKLAGLIGLVMGSLGLRYVGVAAGAAILFGGMGGVLALVLGRRLKSHIPFGPYLAAGAFVAIVWGNWLAMRYLNAVT
jgi:leader peptidase (prepilin peptidase)/N-methyltransferase